MKNVLLLSLLFATIAIPARASRLGADRGARWAATAFLAFACCWGVLFLYLYPRL